MSPDNASDNLIFMSTLERFHDLRVLVHELATQVTLEVEHSADRIEKLEKHRKECNEIRMQDVVLFERMKVEDKQRNEKITNLIDDVKILTDAHVTNQGVKKFVTKWWYPVIMMIAGAVISIVINSWIS